MHLRTLFFPRTIRQWNELPDHITVSQTAETFSARLKGDDSIVPVWYSVGNRRMSIIHARMGLLCSPLNDHLFSHIHVVDNPSCQCGFPRENNKHFLLDCPLYAVERAEMINELRIIEFRPTIRNLLFGTSELEDTINIDAFKIIQNFLVQTSRF